MAVDLGTTGVYSIAAAVGHENAYTMFAWSQHPNVSYRRTVVLQSRGGYSDYEGIAMTDGYPELRSSNAGGAFGGTQTAINTWQAIAIRRTTNSLVEILWWDGSAWSGQVSNTTSVAGRTAPDQTWIGGVSTSDDLHGRYLAHVRIWGAALTSAELSSERESATAVRTTNLWSAYEFATGALTTDGSGNSRTLTSNGSPVWIAGPIAGGTSTQRRLLTLGIG